MMPVVRKGRIMLERLVEICRHNVHVEPELWCRFQLKICTFIAESFVESCKISKSPWPAQKVLRLQTGR